LSSLGDRIKKLRQNLSLTQEQLASKIHVTKSAISLFESNKSSISNKTLLSIAQHLNTNVEYLLNDREVNVSNGVSYGFDDSKNNMLIIPVKAYGGFLAGHTDKAYLDTLDKAVFPFIQGPSYAFEVEDFSMFLSMKERGFLFKYGYEPGMYVATTKLPDFSWLRKGRDYVFQCADGILIKRFVKMQGHACYVDSINGEYNPVSPLMLSEIVCIYLIEKTIDKPSS